MAIADFVGTDRKTELLNELYEDAKQAGYTPELEIAEQVISMQAERLVEYEQVLYKLRFLQIQTREIRGQRESKRDL